MIKLIKRMENQPDLVQEFSNVEILEYRQMDRKR